MHAIKVPALSMACRREHSNNSLSQPSNLISTSERQLHIQIRPVQRGLHWRKLENVDSNGEEADKLTNQVSNVVTILDQSRYSALWSSHDIRYDIQHDTRALKPNVPCGLKLSIRSEGNVDIARELGGRYCTRIMCNDNVEVTVMAKEMHTNRLLSALSELAMSL